MWWIFSKQIFYEFDFNCSLCEGETKERKERKERKEGGGEGEREVKGSGRGR